MAVIIYLMSKIIAKDLLTKLASFRVTGRAYERAQALKESTTMDVNETLRLWYDEVLDHLEAEASKYTREKSA